MKRNREINIEEINIHLISTAKVFQKYWQIDIALMRVNIAIKM